MLLYEDIGTKKKNNNKNIHEWTCIGKTKLFLITNTFFVFKIILFYFTNLCIKMILKYAITELFDIPFFFMQNVCKMAINGFSHIHNVSIN